MTHHPRGHTFNEATHSDHPVFDWLVKELSTPEPLERIKGRRLYCQAQGLETMDVLQTRASDGRDVGRALARVHVADDTGASTLATGILIGEGLLLTTNAAIPTKTAARQTQATFQHEYDVDGTLRRPVHFQVTDNVFLTSITLGYTIVSVAHQSVCGKMITDFGGVPIFEQSGKTLKSEKTHLLQHHNGAQKSLSLHGNAVMGVAGPHLYTDSADVIGANGAIVLNTDWILAGLHIGVVRSNDRIVGNQFLTVNAIAKDVRRRAHHSNAHAKRILPLIIKLTKKTIRSEQPEPAH